MRILIFALLLTIPLAMAANGAPLPCELCGAYNSPRAARCTVCGGPLQAHPPGTPDGSRPAAPRKSPPAASPKPEPPRAAPSPVVASPSKAAPSPHPARSPEPVRPPEPRDVTGPKTGPTPAPRPVEQRTASAEKGAVELESSPAGASVRVGPRSIGRTPLRFETSAGTYRATLSLEGHTTRGLRFRIRAGKTLRRSVTLAPRDRAFRSTRDHERTAPVRPPTPAEPEPAPAWIPAPVVEPWTGRPGTLVVVLAHRGESLTSSDFTVRIDDGAEAHGRSEGASLASDLVRTYRFERAIRAGSHRVTVKLLGVRSDREDGTMEETSRQFTVSVRAGETATLYHEWPGGIEEFGTTQPCCQRGHTPPR